MALPTARPLLGSCGSPICSRSFLLLLLSLGWIPRLQTQTTKTSQEATLLHAVNGAADFASLPTGLFLGLTCEEVSDLSMEQAKGLAMAVRQKNITLRGHQLRCLARRLPRHLTDEELNALPLDLLLFLNPAMFPGQQACAHFFSLISKANVDVLPRRSLERQRLLMEALKCQGVYGFQVSEADVRALGGLACDLPGKFVARSSEVLLPWLAGCQGPLDQSQEKAVREVLRSGRTQYGPPSKWSVSTLDALQSLVAVLDESIVQSIPKDVKAEWLQHISRDPSRLGSKLTVIHPRFRRDAEQKACPPGKEPYKVDEDLIFYQNWELEACVDGTMLARQMDLVNEIPFTYEQLSIFKHKLDKTYPQGYPESLIQQLGHFFRYVSPEDIHQWNVTSPDTVKTLLKVSKGQKMNAQAIALVACYLRGGGQLDEDMVKALGDIPLSYLCDFSPQDLHSVPSSVMWLVGPQDLDKCSQRHLGLLYQKACSAFQNVSGLEYFEKIKTFLGGASVKDLRALSQHNVSMDIATFKRLQVDSLVGLSVAEVQKLLGPNIVDLKTEEDKSPVRDWLFRQHQKDLDRLGLGLQGGIPNGYLVLDFNVREAFSSRASLLGPGFVLIWIPALLPALRLS
ncbi:mesothelin isoform 1 preproprotein [Mus musculus]|uniref:Mesothelin n=1 Tax=Mus musculus TaxID=10090 RepID=MSLN_MOUSE|nr:mesothelin isoform 1 preproprotein [Mus musculus]NP_061345.1 mesothelin isoform 1 preproprotein [Mus musculus]Q61468.1 RecName: Full=Mesothelin; AltName: Full=Pre-pro-megakaryocyte-potentiating factor; Contains: RecName: Full=Megakaryocyte-potentiating factor; Short=MPF; Contains: RecName: Full=Mesothelin, cleaved form; Flags: Precursor [Mus musculus]AAH23753.1 Mesothelin [Mus musculus]EDL22444.1 mesothelin [Mus musculus]BAA13077.1 megakaryocyte potentiating factor [Mus musculus]BAE25864.1|eukprot:NP_061345.1 mesothelin precursor [Mus musculus]